MENAPCTYAERELKSVCDGIRDRTHWLLYGRPESTAKLLRTAYEAANTWSWALCTWHDASAITKPMDFFEPILRKKYEDKYDELAANPSFQDAVRTADYDTLTALCEREQNSKEPNHQKMPVLFIDGIEQLFFKFDYGHVPEADRPKILEGLIQDKCFGTCLRSNLHHASKGIINGTVRDPKGIEFAATLGDYGYLFYADNFRWHIVAGENSA